MTNVTATKSAYLNNCRNRPLLYGDDVIDINKASAEEIDRVPLLKGHGFEIVRYREERGGFKELRQLDEVPGLAGKTEGIASVAKV